VEQTTTIELDIAKYVFQVHGADAAGHVLFRKRMTRTKLLGFLAAQTARVVAMEACAGAHYWRAKSASWAIGGSPGTYLPYDRGTSIVDHQGMRAPKSRRRRHRASS
jgi:hypothetical protein